MKKDHNITKAITVKTYYYPLNRKIYDRYENRYDNCPCVSTLLCYWCAYYIDHMIRHMK